MIGEKDLVDGQLEALKSAAVYKVQRISVSRFGHTTLSFEKNFSRYLNYTSVIIIIANDFLRQLQKTKLLLLALT